MLRGEFDREVWGLISNAVSLIPDSPPKDRPYADERLGVRKWHEYEHKIFAVGEELRKLAAREKKLFNRSQLEAIVALCSDPKAGRGRQSFLSLLGRKKYAAYGEQIVPLLKSEDVDGHVIGALYRMGRFDLHEKVRPFLDHRYAWVRNEARRYMDGLSEEI